MAPIFSLTLNACFGSPTRPGFGFRVTRRVPDASFSDRDTSTAIARFPPPPPTRISVSLNAASSSGVSLSFSPFRNSSSVSFFLNPLSFTLGAVVSPSVMVKVALEGEPSGDQGVG